jgi:hypothetical protein
MKDSKKVRSFQRSSLHSSEISPISKPNLVSKYDRADSCARAAGSVVVIAFLTKTDDFDICNELKSLFRVFGRRNKQIFGYMDLFFIFFLL